MRDFSVYDIFRKNSLAFANLPALVCNDEILTFSQLKDRVDQICAGLGALGVGPGERIAVIGQNCGEYVFLLGAAARLGAILVPINWRLSDDEVRYILTDAAPKVIVHDKDHAERIKSMTAAEASGPICFAMNYPASAPDRNLSDLTGAAVPAARATADTPYCLIYTAAVSGKPRGAVLTHGNILTGNLQSLATMSLTHADTYLNMLPLFHITGLNLCLAVLHAGGKNVILAKFDATAALSLIRREKVTVLGSFPPMLANLEQAMDQGPSSPESLRHVLGIDTPDQIASFEKKTGAVFWMLYGQTETSGMVTFSPASEKPGSAGRQGLMIRMAIVDADDRPLPTGEVGEIVVQGPLVFQGFWNREADNRTIFRNGWLHTGDNGCLDADGYLWFKGRKPEKELIKPGGENVYPAEVEKVILEHPEVAQVCVIGVPDPKFGEGIKAVCVLKSGASLTGQALIAFVGARIARYKKPQYVDFVAQLPKKPDGTIDRAKVKENHGG